MAIEIERKFLLKNDNWRQRVIRSQVMQQGYLAKDGGKSSVRVRLEGDSARLNIKAAVVGRSRAEYDYPLPLADAEEILRNLSVGVVEKTRHWVREGEHEWEIDEFLGDNAGLIVAELELHHADESFAIPDWAGDEVTDDVRYYNHSLSLRPFKDWT